MLSARVDFEPGSPNIESLNNSSPHANAFSYWCLRTEVHNLFGPRAAVYYF